MATGNAAVVTSIYSAITGGQTPPAADLAVYTAQLNSNALTTAQVATLIESSSFVTTVVNPIIREYQAAFGRVPDAAGLKYWIGIAAPLGPNTAYNTSFLSTIATTFSNSSEFQSRYGTAFTATTVVNATNGDALLNALYNNVLGRGPDVVGKAYWLGANSTVAQILTSFANSPEFVNLTTAPIQSYQNAQVAGNAATSGSLLANVSAVTTNFAFTTAVDTLTGTTGNDTFVADNSVTTSPQYTVADTVSGNGGNDTLKLYLNVANATNSPLNAQTFGTINGIANLYINGGGLTAASASNFSTLTGVSQVELDSPFVNTATQGYTITMGSGQTLQLDKVNEAATFTQTLAIKGSGAGQTINLNAVGTDSTNKGVILIDENTASVTNLTLNGVGASSKATIQATGAGVTTLTLTGAQGLTLVENTAALANAVTKVDASAATGKIALDMTAQTTAVAGFTFTGGTATDTLTINATTAGLQGLTAGSQLDGGAGSDNLAVATVLTVNSGTAALNTILNGIKNFEVLQFNTTTNVVDASQLTASYANHYAINSSTAATQGATITKMADASIVDFLSGTSTSTNTFAGIVGAQTLNINVGTATGTGINTGTTTVTGWNTINVVSNGVSGTNLLSFTNDDNVVFKISGADATTLAVSAGATTGVKIDGSAATGILTITGSTKGDIVIGGSAADVINTKAGGSSTLTGGAGADTFDVHLTVNTGGTGTAAVYDTITDFLPKTDKIILATQGTAAFKSTAVAVGVATSIDNAVNIASNAAADSTTDGQISWFQYGGNTYIVEDIGHTASNITATDIVVKLTGLIDLSTATLTGATIS